MHPESENKPIYPVHLCRSVYAIVYGDNSTLRIRERYVATTSLPIISDQHERRMQWGMELGIQGMLLFTCTCVLLHQNSSQTPLSLPHASLLNSDTVNKDCKPARSTVTDQEYYDTSRHRMISIIIMTCTVVSFYVVPRAPGVVGWQ